MEEGEVEEERKDNVRWSEESKRTNEEKNREIYKRR